MLTIRRNEHWTLGGALTAALQESNERRTPVYVYIVRTTTRDTYSVATSATLENRATEGRESVWTLLATVEGRSDK